MSEATKEKILAIARHELALYGYQGSSMRVLSKKIGISPSVLYYHFTDKNHLLTEVYLETNRNLGISREKLSHPSTFEEALRQRIQFQFDHAEEITAVLKYYFHFRTTFKRNPRGFLPEKTYLHIEEILEKAQNDGTYHFPDLDNEAKVIVHAINGFVLEYFPSKLTQKEKVALIDTIAGFILRALQPYKL